MIKEELKASLSESSSFDAPEFSNTNINKEQVLKKSILISALMGYFDIESINAEDLVEPIEKLAHKLSVDKTMNKIIALSQKDPLGKKAGSIATKNLFLIHLRNKDFNFGSPTSLNDVESEYENWLRPKKRIK